jgi:hypothetical protein
MGLKPLQQAPQTHGPREGSMWPACQFFAAKRKKKDHYLHSINGYLLYKDETAAGPTQPSTLKIGVGSSFQLGLAPSQGETPNVGPRG